MTPRDPNPPDSYNQVSIDLLFADADLALTFTEIAMGRTERGAIARNTLNARKAYDLIIRARSSLLISMQQSESLDRKVTLLRDRLVELGETVD